MFKHGMRNLNGTLRQRSVRDGNQPQPQTSDRRRLHWRLTWPAPRGLRLPRSKPYNSSVQSSGVPQQRRGRDGTAGKVLFHAFPISNISKKIQRPLAEHFLVPIQPDNWMVYCIDEEYMKNFVGHFYYMEGHWSVGQELRGLLASSFMNSAAEGDEKENG